MTSETVEPTQTPVAPQTTAPDGGPRRSSHRHWTRWLESYGLLLVTVAIAAFFSFYGPTRDTFPTWANIKIVLASQSVITVIAVGLLVPLIANAWDLSVGSIAGLSAVFCASLLSNGAPVVVGIVVPLLIAVLVGVVNALITTRLSINAVITTIGTTAIIAGLVQQKTGGLSMVSNLPAWLTAMGHNTVLGIPVLVWLTAVVALAVYYLLEHTPMGRYLYALGANPDAARLVGIRTDLLLSAAFVIAALLSGFAGLMQVAYASGATPSVGPGFTNPALAAAFLSAAAIKPGKYNVGGAIVALLFLACVNSGLNLAGAQPYISSYVNGAALLFGIGLAIKVGQIRASRAV